MENKFKETFEDFLKRSNLTKEEFAKKRGIKLSRVKEWLEGKASPRLQTVLNIKSALNITVDYFLGLKDKKE